MAGRGRTPKRLTLQSIRAMCTKTAFDSGRRHYDYDRIASVGIDRDIVTGKILAYERYSVRISLRTGKRSCPCEYSRAGICSHMAGVLIYASKDLGATLPDGAGWTLQDYAPDLVVPDMPPRPDYRGEVDAILASEADTEYIESELYEITKLASACESEGDPQEALRIYIELSDSLLSNIDYHRMPAHPLMNVLRMEHTDRCPLNDPSVYRMWWFYNTMQFLTFLVVRWRSRCRQRRHYISYFHRMFVKTNPDGPASIYRAAALLMCHNREDAEYLKSLHDPIVPGRIPNRVDDPRGFETATGMAEMQKQILSQLKTVS